MKVFSFFTKINLLTLLSFSLLSFFILYKLDYPYFFTDEILYTDAGNEYYYSNFSKNLQHPFVAKYIVGFVTLFGPEDVYQNSVFFLRLPFALTFLASAFIIYKIIKNQFENFYLAIFSSFWYVFLPFSFFSNRMVMMESPMHFFTLLFHFYFIKGLKNDDLKNYIVAGIFMGLAIATKIPALILTIFSLIVFILFTTKNIKKLFLMYLSAVIVFLSTYIHFLITLKFYGIRLLFDIFNDVIIKRNTEGKLHIVNETVYTLSPWWYYYFYILQKYTIFQIFISIFGFIFSLHKRSKFLYYWLLFFVLNLLFFQSIPLKAERYISTIEIPLTILVSIGIYNFYNKFKNNKVLILLLFLQVIIIFFTKTISMLNQQPTSYHALRLYFENKTNNFTSNEKIFVSGSTRTMRWYKQKSAPNAFTHGGDFNEICNNFNQFNYVVFDIDDLYRDVESNLYYKIIISNYDKYNKEIYKGFEIFTKKHNTVIDNPCLITKSE